MQNNKISIINDNLQVLEKKSKDYSQLFYVYHKRWKIKLELVNYLPNLRLNDFMRDAFLNMGKIWSDSGSHPNILTCYYYDIFTGLPTLLLEHFQGQSLKNTIGKQLIIKNVLDISIQLARALQHLHNHGIVVKSLHPDICYLDNTGFLKLDDINFVNTLEEILLNYRNQDIIKLFDPNKRYFINNNRIGVPEYIAPELFNQINAGYEADIYSFGMILFELITGQSPFILEGIPANARWMVYETVQKEGIPIEPKAFRNNCPDELNEIVMKCLEKDPAKRRKNYSHFKEIEQELIKIYENMTGQFYPRESFKEIELKADTLNNKAVISYDLGDIEKAKEYWEEANKIYPEHLETSFNLGYYKWKNSKIAGEDYFNQFKLLSNKYKFNLEYTRYFEWLLLERGDIDEIKNIQNSELKVESDQELLDIIIDQNIPNCQQICKIQAKEPLDYGMFLDSKTVVIGGWQEIYIWDTEENKEIFHFYEPKMSLKSLSISKDKKYLAAGSLDDIIRIWDLDKNKLFNQLVGHAGDVYSVKFSNNGNYLISGSEDGTIKIWDIETGKELKTIIAHKDAINSVDISFDDKYIVSGSSDKSIKVLEFSSGKVIQTLQGHTSNVKAVCFTKDGEYIISASWDKSIRLWDWKNNQLIKMFSGHTLDVYSVSVSSDNKFLISAGLDKTIRLWDISTGIEIRRFIGHNTTITSVNFSEDGNYIISTSEDKTAYIWHIRNFDKNDWNIHHPFPVISKPKNLVNILDDNRKIKIHLDQIRKYLAANLFENAYISVREALKIPKFSSDKKLKTLIYNIATNAVREKISTIRFYHMINLENFVNINFSIDENYLLITLKNNTVKVYDIFKDEFITNNLENIKWMRQLIISPDNRFYITGRFEQTVKLWNLATKKEIFKFTGHSLPIRSLCFSPDGKYIASASLDKTIRIWSLETLKEKFKLTGHIAGVNSVRFSPNGLLIATGSDDRTIRLYDANNGNEINKFLGQTRSVTSVTFTPNSKYLISASEDKTIRVWDVNTGEEIKKIAAHNDNISVVLVSPYGRFIASTSIDNTIRLWELDWEWNFSSNINVDKDIYPYLSIFTYLHRPVNEKNPLIRTGKPEYSENDILKLQHHLSHIGFGKIKISHLQKLLNEFNK